MLLAGIVVFMFPFIWMVGTSMKTDEEMGNTAWFPAIPHFCPGSPYVRSTPKLERPGGATQSEWNAALPTLTGITRDALKNAELPPGAGHVDLVRYKRCAIQMLIDRISTKVRFDLWAKGGKPLFDAYRRLMTPTAISEVLDDRLARLELMGLQIRSLNAHIYPMCDKNQFIGRWKIVSGNARFLAARDGTILSYHFDSSSSPPVRLRYNFTFPMDPSELHKIILSLRADNSWHRLDLALDVGGKHWVSAEPSYLGQNRAASIFFQPPTFEDKTFKSKVWITLNDAGPAPAANAGRAATLWLTLRPSSTLRAIWGKAKRNYERAFHSVPFWLYVWNSTLLVLFTLGGTLFSSAFVAYAFARLNWPGRSFAFVVLLATMMLPAQVTMIPGFLIWRFVGAYNTLIPIWLPAWFGGAFFIFLMVQYMKTIPKELEEAARIDGLGPFRTWAQIILPQVKPSLAAIAIMTFMGAWNEFMGPLIYLRDQAKFPLSLGLFGMQVDMGADWSTIMAGNVLMTIPVIIVFFIFQRYFIEGMTLTGIKG